MLLRFTERTGIAGGALLGHKFVQPGEQFRIVSNQPGNDRMLRRELYRCRAKDRVNAGGEDRDLPARIGDVEVDLRALAAANPVALHGAHLLRPAFELIQIAN